MLTGWWVHNYMDQPIVLVAWVFWVIFSITLHELAHGWAAIWQGDDTPIRLQRMTMNPLVHMGGMSLLVFALIGIAWGIMPVNPSKFRWGRQGNIVVSGAGPAMNILLAIIALTIAGLWETFGPAQQQNLYANVATFFFIGGMLNIVLALFNLLPIPPLDGSQILAGLSFRAHQLFQSPQAQMFGLFVMLAVFFSGVFGIFLTMARNMSGAYISLIQSLLG